MFRSYNCNLFGAIILVLAISVGCALRSEAMTISRFDINRDGELLGLEVLLSKQPDIIVRLDGQGRVFWLVASIPQAKVLLNTAGAISLSELNGKHGEVEVSYDDTNRLRSVGAMRFTYETVTSRLIAILLGEQKLEVTYSASGLLQAVGGQVFHYRINGSLEKLGRLSFKYDARNRLEQVGSIDIRYDPQRMDKLVGIGKVSVRYDALYNRIIGLLGREKQTAITIVWISLECLNIQPRYAQPQQNK